MLIFVILFALTIPFIVWAILDEWNRDIPIVFISVFGLVIAIVALTLANRNNYFKETIEEYNNLKEQVEEYNSLVSSNKIPSFEYDIRDKVLDMNNTISHHKVMSKSLWTGLWNSEEIGSLEKLKLNAVQSVQDTTNLKILEN